MGFFKHKLNPALNGGVTGGEHTNQSQRRREDIVDFVLGDDTGVDEAMPVFSGDHSSRVGKKGGRQVSLEGMAGDTIDMQQALDDLVEQENVGHGAEAPKTDGLAPCQRVNKGESDEIITERRRI